MTDRDSGWQWVPAVNVGNPGRYCNNVQIIHSLWDFNFEFAQMAPIPRGENEPPEVAHNLVERIVMSPQHAKAFLAVLAQNVEQWEEQFGELPTGPPQ